MDQIMPTLLPRMACSLVRKTLPYTSLASYTAALIHRTLRHTLKLGELASLPVSLLYVASKSELHLAKGFITQKSRYCHHVVGCKYSLY